MATAERITRQYDIDCWQIALARYDKLELGYQRIMELTELAQQARREYAGASTRDNEQDYYRVHMDRELQEIARNHMTVIPFETRYPELKRYAGHRAGQSQGGGQVLLQADSKAGQEAGL